MIISSLAVQHVRTHQKLICELSPGVTVITGRNGSGKTSLIEAVYMALRGTSFRGSDKEILQYNTSWWRVDIKTNEGDVRTVKFDSLRSTGRKQFVIDEKTAYRLSPIYKYPVVLFEPDDLRLINGSPTRRRYFIDTLIASIDPQYGVNLRKYERALKQRNSLLKKQLVTTDDLFVWNVALSEYGALVVSQRVAIVERLNAKLNEIYNTIATSKDEVSIHYSDTLIGNTKQKLMSELHANHDRDVILGYTTVGPHRHDIAFNFNHAPALSSASRGEIRTIILALKFLEVGLIEQFTDKKPIILLDDVFGELDESRQKHLVSNFKDYQIIVSSVNENTGMNKPKIIQLST